MKWHGILKYLMANLSFNSSHSKDYGNLLENELDRIISCHQQIQEKRMSQTHG